MGGVGSRRDMIVKEQKRTKQACSGTEIPSSWRSGKMVRLGNGQKRILVSLHRALGVFEWTFRSYLSLPEWCAPGIVFD